MFTLCGNFANNDSSVVNGQVTKTRNVAFLLSKKTTNLKIIDTSKGKIRTLFYILKYFHRSDVFFLCVSRNGTKFLAPLLKLLKFLHKKTKLVYLCIGTCPLPQDYIPGKPLTKKQRKIGKALESFDAVCPETKVLQSELKQVFGLKKVEVFKNWQIGKEIINLKNYNIGSRKYVYFSRISEEKNIRGLFQAVERLDKAGVHIKIDFFGPIEKSIEQYFYNQIAKHSNCVYKGIIESQESTKVLSKYKAMIFTTNCLEGTPGAIIDSVFANVPVISQKFWAVEELVVAPNVGLADNDIEKNIIKFEGLSQDDIDKIKKNCFAFANSYSERSALEALESLIQ